MSIAIRFLNEEATSCEPLIWETHLAEVNKEHVYRLGQEGSTKSSTLDGKELKKRVSENEGNILEHYGFNIQLHGKDEEEIVCFMLIDDGLTSRSRRNNIFNKNFKKGAVAFETHRDLDNITGLVMCQGYYKKGDEHPLHRQV